MIEIRDVDYRTAERTLVSDIDLVVRPGELTAISGTSGSGKTTLLSVVGGLVRPSTGSVLLDGEATWRGSGDPLPAMSFILQVYGLVPILSARENVSIALRARGVAARTADDDAEEMLDRLRIGDLSSRQVEELSGGQLQRVACARALSVKAPVLLADEPTSELDHTSRDLVMGLLRERAEAGATVVVATHDDEVVDQCDVHHRMDEGRLVSVSTPG